MVWGGVSFSWSFYEFVNILVAVWWVGGASVSNLVNTVIELWTVDSEQPMLVNKSDWYFWMTNLEVSNEYKFVSSSDGWSEALS